MTGEPGSDTALWTQVCVGDAEAFVAVYRRHADRVLMQCLRHLGDRHEAEDAASIVFFETWRLRARVRLVEDSVLPWMLVTALNICRNQRRAARRYAGHLSRLPVDGPAVGDVADEVADAAEQIEMRERLGRALATLRRGEREVVMLCLASGLSYDQAAAALRIPVGTVRSRLSRGRSRLREALANERNETRSAGSGLTLGKLS